jgi:hypothetical protein
MGYATLTHPTEVLYLIAPSYLLIKILARFAYFIDSPEEERDFDFAPFCPFGRKAGG